MIRPATVPASDSAGAVLVLRAPQGGQNRLPSGADLSYHPSVTWPPGHRLFLALADAAADEEQAMALNLGEHLSRMTAARGGPDFSGLAGLSGPFIWMHADERAQAHGLLALSEELLQKEAQFHVLVTLPHDAKGRPPEISGRVVLDLDGAELTALLGVLASRGLWPRAALVATQVLPVVMIRALARRKIPVIALEADAPPGFAAGWRHVPGFSRVVLRQLSHVFLQGAQTRAAWIEQGLPPENLSVCGRLSPTPAALGCNETEREELAEAFRHRTMWLAMGLPEREEDAIIAAHLEALRESHRLVLLVLPADPARAPALKHKFAAEFVTAQRSVDDPLSAETQVYIVDTEGERGLWYRLAVACYLGGTLSGEGATVSPLEPASLGCAIVHGRVFGRFAEAFDLLRAARATRMIQSPEALGSAICAALRPEQAADQAHRGWQVISDGFQATETVLAAVLRAALDGRA